MNTTEPKDIKIRFEAGDHTIGEESDRLTQQILVTQDNRTTEWNQAVTHRMAAYSPDFIALDGGMFLDLSDNPKFTHTYKKLLWAILPDDPSLFTDNGEIYVLAGDIIYGHSDLPLHHTMRTAARFAVGTSLGIQLGSAGDALIHGYRREVAAYDNRTGNYDPEKSKKISRRSFFKTAGMVGGGVLFVRANQIAASSSGTASDAFSLLTETLTPFDTFRYTDQGSHTDGRTALLIQKSFDFAKAFDFEHTTVNGSVIMGHEHIPYSELYIRDEEKRSESIRELSRVVINMARSGEPDKFSSNGSAPSIEEVRDMLTKYFVFKVISPNQDALKEDLDKEIERIVTLEGYMTSPKVTGIVEDVLRA